MAIRIKRTPLFNDLFDIRRDLNACSAGS